MAWRRLHKKQKAVKKFIFCKKIVIFGAWYKVLLAREKMTQ